MQGINFDLSGVVGEALSNLNVYTKNQIDSMLSKVSPTRLYLVVDSLPTMGDTTQIYILTGSPVTAWVYVGNEWLQIEMDLPDLDLTMFVKRSELGNYATQSDLGAVSGQIPVLQSSITQNNTAVNARFATLTADLDEILPQLDTINTLITGKISKSGSESVSGVKTFVDGINSASISTANETITNQLTVNNIVATGTVHLQGNGTLTGLKDPVDDTDAVNKRSVKSLISGLLTNNYGLCKMNFSGLSVNGVVEDQLYTLPVSGSSSIDYSYGTGESFVSGGVLNEYPILGQEHRWIIQGHYSNKSQDTNGQLQLRLKSVKSGFFVPVAQTIPVSDTANNFTYEFTTVADNNSIGTGYNLQLITSFNDSTLSISVDSIIRISQATEIVWDN